MFNTLALLLASSNLKQCSTVCPFLPQNVQTANVTGAAVFGARDKAAAAAAAATPTLCASSFLRASSTCCTVNSGCASREVVRAVYFVPLRRTEMSNSLSESSSEKTEAAPGAELARGAAGGRVDCK